MDDEIKRTPIPESSVERFMVIVFSMVEDFGIDELPEVYRQVEMLGEAVDRHIWEQRHKVSPQRRVHNDRKRFISIFKARYLQLMDLEYRRKITPVDSKLMNQANRTLRDEGHDAESYLRWLFEEYLVDNPKFCPPSLKQVCSNFFLHKFIFESRQMGSVQAEQDAQEKEAHDVVSRGRVLLRSGIGKEDSEKVRKALKDYSEGRIILHELRRLVEAVGETNLAD